MDLDLTANEIRTLCSLVEKERTTPDQYPLSTNSLRLACNQKTSREPVLDLSERDVDAALLSLRQRGLVRSSKPQGSRAWKHKQVITEVLPLDDGELAVLAVLGLRGPQTSGELRQRTDRMHPFEDTDAVDATLARLAARDEALTKNIGREAGQSQDRWRHLLGEDAVPASASRQRAMAATFHELHESGFFFLPNPWDRGSARMLVDLGAQAIATTSAGLGRVLGKDDQEVTRDELVAHVADLAEFVDVPINVDSEMLFPLDDGGISRTVDLLAEAGAAGVSIEDYDSAMRTIMPASRATEAVAEAVEACNRHNIVLTARAESWLYGGSDLDDTIARLQAFEAAGAHCLYAPGLTSIDDIELMVSEITAPLNVLALPAAPALDALAAVGVRRASSGSVLYNAASAAARERAEQYFSELR